MYNMDMTRDAAHGLFLIAERLGTTESWGADLLDDVADIVMRSGFPHPGNMDVQAEEYVHQIVPRWNDINAQLHRAEVMTPPIPKRPLDRT